MNRKETNRKQKEKENKERIYEMQGKLIYIAHFSHYAIQRLESNNHKKVREI